VFIGCEPTITEYGEQGEGRGQGSVVRVEALVFGVRVLKYLLPVP